MGHRQVADQMMNASENDLKIEVVQGKVRSLSEHKTAFNRRRKMKKS